MHEILEEPTGDGVVVEVLINFRPSRVRWIPIFVRLSEIGLVDEEELLLLVYLLLDVIKLLLVCKVPWEEDPKAAIGDKRLSGEYVKDELGWPGRVVMLELSKSLHTSLKDQGKGAVK